MRKEISAALLSVMIASTLIAGCGKAATQNPEIDGTVSSGSGQENSENAQSGLSVQENAQNGSTAQKNAAPSLNILDDKYRTTYEVFVYSFYDSDKDGIGDLKGLTQKLDYINDGDNSTDTDLGCNEIWLMPISPSPTYHKYDVIDYKDIDPEYGTLEDFDNLISACHERGVNVIIDTVFNHTSVEHPWFTEASEFLRNHSELTFDEAAEQCPFINYYSFDTEKKDGYEPLPGTAYFYEARFWSGMPDLNLDSDSVRAELKDVLKFWIDRGVDGFRLDAVTSYYTGEDLKNTEFLTWINDTAKELNPSVYIVGEAWTSSATYTKYYKSGVDSFFDFDYAGSEGLIAGLARGTTPAEKFGTSLMVTEHTLSQINEDAVDAPFYTNHDMARSAGYFTGKGTEDKIKLAGALNLLMSGNAFVYYGEELGMKGSGKDENKRAPMQWTSDPKAEGMCKGPTAMDSFSMKYPALDEQQEDPASIYNYFKSAIKLRNMYPVIARGTTKELEDLSGKELCVMLRSVSEEEAAKFLAEAGSTGVGNGAEAGGADGGNDAETGNEAGGDAVNTSDASALDISAFGPLQLLVIINTSGEEQTIDISADERCAQFGAIDYQLMTSDSCASIENQVITIPAYGIVVLK
ncbi:alpha-amylase family glycosyl hydrolase [Butyrivibrio sp. FCS014]|uniref:alpha-amylase family glycosyl hydrolase n=1 Tax=Butyrivibrio sp. FCS014 TaxID=1408304 RepID=UPI000464DCD8|nr:alpha-amylase family glycosyl hydrolase [Butyrivibrio sp. FCS014]